MRSSQIIQAIVLSCFLLLLAGCATEPRDVYTKRDETIKQITAKEEISQIEKSGRTLKQVVSEQKAKSDKSKNVSDYIDYYLIRQAAIEVLESKINQGALGSGLAMTEDSQLEAWTQELLDIDPYNKVAMGYVESRIPVDPRIKMLYQLSPSSKIAGNFNVSIYSSLVDDKAFSKKKLNDQFSLVSSGNRISSDQLLKLLAGDPKKIPSCQALVIQKSPLDDLVVENLDHIRMTIDKSATNNEQSANSNNSERNTADSAADFMLGRCLNDIFSRYGLGFNLHNSATDLVSKPGVLPHFKMTSTSNIGDFLVGVAEEYDINFLLGFDRIAVFAGRDLPRDIDQDMYVYFVQTRYVPVIPRPSGPAIVQPGINGCYSRSSGCQVSSVLETGALEMPIQ